MSHDYLKISMKPYSHCRLTDTDIHKMMRHAIRLAKGSEHVGEVRWMRRKLVRGVLSGLRLFEIFEDRNKSKARIVGALSSFHFGTYIKFHSCVFYTEGTGQKKKPTLIYHTSRTSGRSVII